MSERQSDNLAVVILAAGKGKRMKSDLPKVLHEVGGEPMLGHVIAQARAVGADPVVVVVGHGREQVESVVERHNASSVVQEEQLGTGHAVRQAKPLLEDFEGDVLVLSGDVPLLRGETLRRLVEYHRRQEAVATVLTAHAPDPAGYGRVLRGPEGQLEAIREHKDCSPAELEVDEINAGIYLFRAKELFAALENLDNDNAQREYYLPGVFEEYWSRGLAVAAFAGDFEEIQGVNSKEDLDRVNRLWRVRGEENS